MCGWSIWGEFGFGPSANESDTPYIAVLKTYEILTNLSSLITETPFDFLRKTMTIGEIEWL
ncbi:hypothetical protein ABIC86_005008 [Paenibacillus sp. DS2363]